MSQHVDDVKALQRDGWSPPENAQPWRDIESAPKDEDVLIAYKLRGRVVVQSARQTEFHGEEIWSWVVDDNKFGPYPIRGYVSSDLLGWQPLPPPPATDK